MSNRFTMPVATALDNSARPGAGWKLAFFQPSTSTPLATYSNENRTVANSNPVVADSAGRFPNVFLSNRPYRVVLSTDEDVQVWDRSPVVGTDIGDLGLTFEGEWSDSATYQSGAIVSHGDLTFISRIDDNENNEPDDGTPGHTSEWMLIDLGGTALEDAEQARDAAEDARDKAQEWAENPEDDPVETGQFSALHHSAKASAARDAAEGAAETVVVGRYNSKAGVEAATIDAAVQSIQLTGYHEPADGGGALLKERDGGPLYVTSNGGAREWELAEQSVYVEQFGAKGDGTTDDATAFNDAAMFLYETGGGVLRAGRGEFLLDSTFTIPGDGLEPPYISFEGAGAEATILKASHTSGPVVRVKGRFSGVRGVTVSATDARRNGAAGSNYGILVEGEDTAAGRPQSGNYSDFIVERQPNHGMVLIATISGSTITRYRITDNGGHGLVVDNGTETGRTNLSRPGQITSFHGVISDNAGNAVVLGGDDGNLNVPYRIVMNNIDTFRNALEAGVRKSSHQAWVFAESSALDACAWGGYNDSSIATTAGVRVHGRSIAITNNRYVGTTRAVDVENISEISTNGIIIDELFVVGDGTPLNPAVVVSASAKNVLVRSKNTDNITSVVIAPSTNGSERWFDGGGVMAREDAPPELELVRTGSGAGAGRFDIAGNAARLLSSTDNDVVLLRNSVERLRLKNNTVNLSDLPTSASGLSSGDLWNDSGTLKIA